MGIITGLDGERGSIEHKFNDYNHWVGSDHRGPTYKLQQRFAGRDNTGSHREGLGIPESRSLDETYDSDPGLFGRIVTALVGEEDEPEYIDLGNETDSDEYDPREHNAPEVQNWIDERLEDGDFQAIDTMLSLERIEEPRVTVLRHLKEQAPEQYDPEVAQEEIEFYDSKDEIESVEHI